MFTQLASESPINKRGNGQTSHLWLAPSQFGSRELAATWVDAEPGSQQLPPRHPESEQVYVIVEGRGEMIVDGEERPAQAGTVVFLPPGAEHAIRNSGSERLSFVTAAAPPFELPAGQFAYESHRPES